MDTQLHLVRDGFERTQREVGALAAHLDTCPHSQHIIARVAACEAGLAVLEARIQLLIDACDFAATHGGSLGGVLAPT